MRFSQRKKNKWRLILKLRWLKPDRWVKFYNHRVCEWTIFGCFFETGYLCVTVFFGCLGTRFVEQAGLELTKIHLCLPRAGIKDVHHHRPTTSVQILKHVLILMFPFSSLKCHGHIFLSTVFIILISNILSASIFKNQTGSRAALTGIKLNYVSEVTLNVSWG